MIDDEFYPGRIMLAEANQWPEDVVRLLRHRGRAGSATCAFHFPVMPRIYYGIREDQRGHTDHRHPGATPPPIPKNGAQWSTFLRNHDELTLEMVSTEERAARCTAGTRRTPGCAPTWASGDGSLDPARQLPRKEIELAQRAPAELCPAAPCLYYGDEIGMGDNIWLPDRDAVRTPMQWTPDRNAGFSTADPGKLYLPVVQSLVYHYSGCNVESQLATSSSLLHWTRGMLTIRRQHPVFGLGRFVPVECDNAHVLAFLRVLGEGDVPDEAPETVLCVTNLSHVPQGSRLDLPGYGGAQLDDLFGGTGFPAVGRDGSIDLTMGSRDFFWLRVSSGYARGERLP